RLVEPVSERREIDGGERSAYGVVLRRIRLGWEPYRLAQGADRHIGALRQEERLRPRGDPDPAAAEWPEPGEDAEDRALAAAGFALQEYRFVRPEGEVDRREQRRAVRQVDADLVERDAALRMGLVRGADIGGSHLAVELLVELKQPVDRGAPVGEHGIAPDEP